MHSHDEEPNDPRAHAVRRIVADLLGEADAAEREQLAADLAADPSLAAERARLEATLGLVRDYAADADAQTLSPEAAARLRRAAEGSTRVLAGPGSTGRAWYATPLFRAAAGFALALGAFTIWQASRSHMLPAEYVATADAKRQQDQPLVQDLSVAGSLRETEIVRDELAKNLRFDSAAGEPAPAAAPMSGTATAAPKDGAELASAETAAPEVDALERSRSLGYGGGSVAQAGLEGQSVEQKLAARLGLESTAPQAAAGPATPGAGGQAASGGTQVGNGEAFLADSSTARGVPVAGASESRFGVRRVLPESSAAPAENLASARVSILGKKPTQAEVERAIARDQANGGSLSGADDFFLGRGKRENEAAPIDGDDRFLLDQLRALGYLEIGPVDHASADRVAPLTQVERARSIEILLADCRRRPNEHPRDMFYRWWGDNPFEYARTDALSTFAVDVDTASYTLARRYLVEGILPTKQQIRTEEFVNYFKGDVPAPTETTFAVAAELAPSPFQREPNAWTLRVALRGREVSRQERQPLALTFVVDVSGSMKEQNRLELVKHALRLLVGELDARDALAIVAFTNDARLVLPMTSARHRGLIESAIHPLRPEGGTNVQAGLRMGYEAALAGLDAQAHNRVVLLSDGVGNIGETDAAALNREVESARKRGVWLNTVGVGMGNHNDAFLEQLADKGDGICNYIDDEREARRALVENFTGAFEPIARDVKIQVEFDPDQVERYRLLGYENRAVADVDFRNDAVDAGEIGAGHQVVALYEVVRTGSGDGPLATVRVRWKPAGRELALNQFAELPAREAAWTVDGTRAAGTFAAASAGFRRSVLVGQLAEVLRRSIHARDDSLETLLSESRKLAPQLADPDFDEFVQMVERTIELIAADWGRYDDLARRLDALRMQHYLKARLEDVARDLDRARLDELDGQIRELEAEIRRELEREPERFPKSKVR
jgi:Ca-activated chloride channel family protein